MFAIGDKVVYPMHGAGIIEKIEEKEVLGETRAYYILHIPYGNMKVMVPVGHADEAGIRPIVSPEELEEVYRLLGEESSEMDDNWNRRFRENMDLLKTGDIAQVAQVVRNLMRVDRVKKLSTGEKKMLTNARQILISEIVLVQDLREDIVEGILEETV
ncbi:MAG: CarD family transcriptional regulator [Bacillota bacterium]|jgi:CarD family transcriptional regulator|nr:CarD family transcriptional regulator [Eubacteriales bacterium]MDI9492486.1 CarD family transcriptional regulator [Bacillota bacterium]NLV69565.1 CarD family transcriptional regulator [Clostridiales bacterium]HRV33924.1 CarD family transcriptional regulator [Anaerovoracaceae bacterium]MDD3537055.1 CarD family transcriptional regulator [Eubacteriales bacterium]